MHCKFNDCTHVKEKGCAVLAAINNGELSEKRFQNYLKIKNESAFYEMSYAEKRKKDKRFGKMIKAAVNKKKK
jgi:ribosome biogenesis GTPase